MNNIRVLCLAAAFALQLACPVTDAGENEGGMQLGLRLPFGGGQPQPLHLSLAMSGASRDYDAIPSRDIASLDLAGGTKLINAQVGGIPFVENGVFVLNASDETAGGESTGSGTGTVILIGAAVVVALILIGQEVFKKGSKEVITGQSE